LKSAYENRDKAWKPKSKVVKQAAEDLINHVINNSIRDKPDLDQVMIWRFV